MDEEADVFLTNFRPGAAPARPSGLCRERATGGIRAFQEVKHVAIGALA